MLDSTILYFATMNDLCVYLLSNIMTDNIYFGGCDFLPKYTIKSYSLY
jgi:hypothetical protein